MSEFRFLCVTAVLLSACSGSAGPEDMTGSPPATPGAPTTGSPAAGAPAAPGQSPPGSAAGPTSAMPGMSAMPGVTAPGVTPPTGDPGLDGPMSGGPNPNNWFGFGGNLEQTYARTDSMIEESNLATLGSPGWEATAPGGVTGTPAVYDGFVYWADWVGNVHAQKITDGKEAWDPPVKFPRGFTSSPFVDATRVYLADRDNMVRALDRVTGKELWSTAISDNKMAQLWSSPMVADGVVVVGLGGKGTSNGGAPYSATDLMSFHGGVVGLNAESGQVIWHFDNTKADGMMYGAGVSSWSSPALDTKRKIAYIGAGNSYYSPASPYSDSLLALNYMTTKPEGELVWHQQFTMNDNFTSGSPQGPDSDVGATPNIFTVDGKDYVAVGDKGGGFYVMDRDKGDLIYPRKRISAGSSTGGVMAPAAYADGTLYITANNSGSTAIVAMNAADGAITWMANEGSGVTYGAPLLLKDVLLVGTTTGFPSGNRGGQVLAYRRKDGTKINWNLPIPNQRGGGMSIYRNTLFVSYGFVFENTSAESALMGGVTVAALGGSVLPEGPTGPVATYAPTYTAIYNEILAEKGCSADRCHGGLGIQLQAAATGYTNLLNGTPTSSGCTSMKFVVPGDPSQSFLYAKLQPNPPCGAQMPLSLMPLTDMEMTQVRTWIEMGAPNN